MSLQFPHAGASRAGRRKTAAALAGAALFVLTAGQSSAIVSSFPTPLGGTNINTFLGADRFYTGGYTGSRAIVANIEAGFVWNGHDALTNVSTYFAPGATGEFDRHATWVGETIAGVPTVGGGEYQRGIAYGSTLWSGAIASSWNSAGTGVYSGSFNFNTSTYAAAYQEAMVGGINGATADVINSSWGTGGGANGSSFFSLQMDALIYASGKTVVFSAGNSGPGENTVFAPASGMNLIAVGSLGADTTTPQYSSVSTFSSRSPTDYFVPTNAFGVTGILVPGGRAAVDITAPGENLTLAFYGGATGGNAFGGPVTGATNQYTTGLRGTSFAAPIVAGGAALIVDAGKALYPLDPKATDGRVVKAVLMNSADKLPLWNNGQTNVGGVVTTTQSLDYYMGTGRMNLSRAFDQYTAGTNDVPGLLAAPVLDTGWDYGRVAQGTPQDYLLLAPISGGSHLTATLDWFADTTLNNTYGSFDNLDLQVWSTLGGLPQSLVGQSISAYNSVEHLSFDLPSDGQYLLRVVWTGNVYNFVNDPHADDYALAWDVTAIPEPTTIGVLGFTLLLAVKRPRRI